MSGRGRGGYGGRGRGSGDGKGGRLAYIQKSQTTGPPPLYPSVENPPQLVEISDKLKYQVLKYQEMTYELKSSPFYVTKEVSTTVRRYTDRYRIRSKGTDALPSWLPSGSAAHTLMPLELRISTNARERQQALKNAAIEANALIATSRDAQMASDAAHKAALFSNWSTELTRQDEAESEGDDEVSDNDNEDNEDFNDYTVDYYDEDHDDGGDEDGAVF